jgi:F-type H+-transporting ATPase subunit gamma
MANIRGIIKRRKAVRNIRTITSAMELIASSRFRRAQLRLRAASPARAQGEWIFAQVVNSLHPSHPLLEPSGGNQAIVVAITSDRGLCGGYNSRLLHAARDAVKAHLREGRQAKLILVGKRGIVQARHYTLGGEFEDRRLEPELALEYFEGNILYELVFELAEALMADYIAGRAAAVQVIFAPMTRSTQPETATLLPLAPEPQRTEARSFEYELYPRGPEALGVLLSEVVRMRLLGCFLHAAASEQSARMTAMHSSTTSADKVVRALTQRINRVRQGQITRELSEIISGADAQK